MRLKAEQIWRLNWWGLGRPSTWQDHCILTIFLGDSKVIVDWLKGQVDYKVAALKNWKDKTKETANCFRNLSVSHIYKEDNGEADSLSKLALHMPPSFTKWVDGNAGPTIKIRLWPFGDLHWNGIQSDRFSVNESPSSDRLLITSLFTRPGGNRFLWSASGLIFRRLHRVGLQSDWLMAL